MSSIENPIISELVPFVVSFFVALVIVISYYAFVGRIQDKLANNRYQKINEKFRNEWNVDATEDQNPPLDTTEFNL